MAHNQVYQPTTTSYRETGDGKPTYLPAPGCCPGRKKRLQFILLSSSIVCATGGVFVLVLGVGGSSAALVTLLVALSLLLVLVGVGLFVMYLRMIGKCNLPCWPTRAARFSQSLVENPADASSRFGTQVTLAADEEESYLGGTAGTEQERSKLMESDNIDAERIGSSEPKIVFKH